MSIMQPLAFPKLITWMLQELAESHSLFGIPNDKVFRNIPEKKYRLFGEELSTPIGPAAGPHTQLAQNIVTSYLTGCRFIELKTVQIIDGEDLPVSKPCIYAQDEGYNVEWSTELKVEEALEEYIKAWFLLHVLMKELDLSSTRDFIFNMSVGYDLEGIKSKKIDHFIEGLKDARHTKIWEECFQYLEKNLDKFSNFTIDDLYNISPHIASSITLSTLHGCPKEEIEQIAEYLLEEKSLNTFIKLNPTLLGEDFVAKTLKDMGYDYITLNSHHFKNDLQLDDGIKMLKRLRMLASNLHLEIGVKLSNTLPVKILRNELPGEEMYMSGRALYPLTINLANILAQEFNGDLLISYSGGVDYFNIDKVLETGIRPITFATTMLKPGGYLRALQMAEKIKSMYIEKNQIDIDKLAQLANEAISDKYHLKNYKVNKFKLRSKLPLWDCQIAPCKNTCPINQDIPEYLKLVSEKRYDEAFKVIIKDNSAPFITGTICNHPCETNCTRLEYEKTVKIREMKKVATQNAIDNYLSKLEVTPLKVSEKVLVIGAGPAGLSVSYFLRRAGVDVTVYEKREKPYGMVQYVIPDFRIADNIIAKDFALVEKSGVKFKFGVDENFVLDKLRKEYDYIVLALGTWKETDINLQGNKEKMYHALKFLEQYKTKKDLSLGEEVLVIGGGDVAIDCARAAKRVQGVKKVKIVYRRTKEYMKASQEEIAEMLAEEIEIKELLNPVSFTDNVLHCEKMVLGSLDSSNRRAPIGTNQFTDLPFDSIVIATGETLDSDILKQNGILLNEQNYPVINEDNETNIPNVYVAGDMVRGPKTIVSAISDGKTVAKAILNKLGLDNNFTETKLSFSTPELLEKKGILIEPKQNNEEAHRCLACNHVCELCVDVCPNRANITILINNKPQVIHIDGMCNECGNCAVFCPHDGKPYVDKLTIFWNEQDFYRSNNIGFILLDEEKGTFKVRLENQEVVSYTLGEKSISSKFMEVINTCIEKYRYLL